MPAVLLWHVYAWCLTSEGKNVVTREACYWITRMVRSIFNPSTEIAVLECVLQREEFFKNGAPYPRVEVRIWIHPVYISL